MLAAQKEEEKIAVEIKSFLGRSMVDDLEEAMGQYALYEELLKRLEPERVLYLAVTQEVHQNAFVDGVGELFLESQRIKLLVFDPDKEVLVKWIH